MTSTNNGGKLIRVATTAFADGDEETREISKSQNEIKAPQITAKSAEAAYVDSSSQRPSPFSLRKNRQDSVKKKLLSRWGERGAYGFPRTLGKHFELH